MKEWFTAAELAELGLPGMPGTESPIIRTAKREGWGLPEREWSETENPRGVWRKRAARGGGTEYHFSLLPSQAQAKLLMGHQSTLPVPVDTSRAVVKAEIGVEDQWSWYDRQPDKVKDKAKRRLSVLEMVEAMVRNGQKKEIAVALIAVNQAVSASSVWGWYGRVGGKDRSNWLPFLADRYVGRTLEAEISAEAWEVFKELYLHLERPTMTRCYRGIKKLGAERGWAIPSERTIARKIEREIAAPVLVLTREGPDALKRMYPALERDRSCFHALEAINGDGHRWDVRVEWEDGEIERPMMIVFQDLYSGKVLAWRVAKTENRESIRLALGDVVEQYGIPEHIWFDNTRAFANKWLTGGAKHRFRWKARDEDPLGLCEQLGIQVHFTLPYSGQSKPVERVFRDFAHDIAPSLAFAGAYTGHSPMNKPANYGERAMPIDSFLRWVALEIAEWNARPGRRTKIAAGRSFDQAFAESYERALATKPKSLIRRGTPEQARLWMLAAEGVTCNRTDGTISLMGNTFWAEFLLEHRAEKLVIRFDPQNPLDGLNVYSLSGAYLGYADVREAAGFNDADAAREHARARKSFMKATKAMAAAERKMGALELVAMQAPALPEPGHVVRPAFGNTVPKLLAAPAEDADVIELFTQSMLRLPPPDDL